MTVKAASHEEGNSEIQGQPSFLIHSFKIMPSLHKALGPLKVWGAARWCMGWSRRLPNGSESLLSVIYLVFNSFQPRTKHFYQTVFCGNRITTGLFQQGVKKRTRRGNNSISGWRRMRWPAEHSRLEPGSSTYSTALIQWSQALRSPDSLTCIEHPSQWGTPHPETRSYSSQGPA